MHNQYGSESETDVSGHGGKSVRMATNKGGRKSKGSTPAPVFESASETEDESIHGSRPVRHITSSRNQARGGNVEEREDMSTYGVLEESASETEGESMHGLPVRQITASPKHTSQGKHANFDHKIYASHNIESASETETEGESMHGVPVRHVTSPKRSNSKLSPDSKFSTSSGSKGLLSQQSKVSPPSAPRGDVSDALRIAQQRALGMQQASDSKEGRSSPVNAHSDYHKQIFESKFSDTLDSIQEVHAAHEANMNPYAIESESDTDFDTSSHHAPSVVRQVSTKGMKQRPNPTDILNRSTKLMNSSRFANVQTSPRSNTNNGTTNNGNNEESYGALPASQEYTYSDYESERGQHDYEGKPHDMSPVKHVRGGGMHFSSPGLESLAFAESDSPYKESRSIHDTIPASTSTHGNDRVHDLYGRDGADYDSELDQTMQRDADLTDDPIQYTVDGEVKNIKSSTRQEDSSFKAIVIRVGEDIKQYLKDIECEELVPDCRPKTWYYYCCTSAGRGSLVKPLYMFISAAIAYFKDNSTYRNGNLYVFAGLLLAFACETVAGPTFGARYNIMIILALLMASGYADFPHTRMGPQIIMSLLTGLSLIFDFITVAITPYPPPVWIRISIALTMISKSIALYGFLHMARGTLKARKYLWRRFRLFLIPFNEPRRLMKEIRSRILAVGWIECIATIFYLGLFIASITTYGYDLVKTSQRSVVTISMFLLFKMFFSGGITIYILLDTDLVLTLGYFGCLGFYMKYVRDYTREKYEELGGWPYPYFFNESRFYILCFFKFVDFVWGIVGWSTISVDFGSHLATMGSHLRFMLTIVILTMIFTDIWVPLLLYCIHWLLRRHNLLAEHDALSDSDDSELDELGIRREEHQRSPMKVRRARAKTKSREILQKRIARNANSKLFADLFEKDSSEDEDMVYTGKAWHAKRSRGKREEGEGETEDGEIAETAFLEESDDSNDDEQTRRKKRSARRLALKALLKSTSALSMAGPQDDTEMRRASKGFPSANNITTTRKGTTSYFSDITGDESDIGSNIKSRNVGNDTSNRNNFTTTRGSQKTKGGGTVMDKIRSMVPGSDSKRGEEYSGLLEEEEEEEEEEEVDWGEDGESPSKNQFHSSRRSGTKSKHQHEEEEAWQHLEGSINPLSPLKSDDNILGLGDAEKVNAYASEGERGLNTSQMSATSEEGFTWEKGAEVYSEKREGYYRTTIGSPEEAHHLTQQIVDKMNVSLDTSLASIQEGDGNIDRLAAEGENMFDLDSSVDYQSNQDHKAVYKGIAESPSSDSKAAHSDSKDVKGDKKGLYTEEEEDTNVRSLLLASKAESKSSDNNVYPAKDYHHTEHGFSSPGQANAWVSTPDGNARKESPSGAFANSITTSPPKELKQMRREEAERESQLAAQQYHDLASPQRKSSPTHHSSSNEGYDDDDDHLLLDHTATIEPQAFANMHSALEISSRFSCDIAPLPDVFTAGVVSQEEMVDHLTTVGFYVVAVGAVPGSEAGFKIFLFASGYKLRPGEEEDGKRPVFCLMELVVTKEGGEVWKLKVHVRCTQAAFSSAFIGELCLGNLFDLM